MIDTRYQAYLVEHLHVHDVRHGERSLFAHLSGTHELLRDWGNPEAVCTAGLFHSVYGTVQFWHQSLAIGQRSTLRNLIGAEAEELVYAFCVAGRPKAFLAQADGTSEPVTIRDHHTGGTLALSRAALSRLLEIEAANLIEQNSDAPLALGQLRKAPISAAARAAVGHRLLQLVNAHAADRQRARS